MDKRILDFTLVPSGLLIMVAYHGWLLNRIMNHPNKTVIGINAINRRLWVHAMMEDASRSGTLAVQTLRNNIMASALLASTAITLSSLIAALMTNGGGSSIGSGTRNTLLTIILGDRSQLGSSVKFFSILICFLAAFLLNVQAIMYYCHASILINVPYKKISSHHRHHQVTSEYVATTVNRGSCFWSLGLRAFYFSFPLFLWIFGPIPMFLSCFLLVFMLYFLDVTFEVGSGEDCMKDDEEVGTPINPTITS